MICGVMDLECGESLPSHYQLPSRMLLLFQGNYYFIIIIIIIIIIKYIYTLTGSLMSSKLHQLVL